MNSEVKCKSCGNTFTEDEFMQHLFGECNLPEKKKARNTYWRNLIKKDLWTFLKKMEKEEVTCKFGECSLTDLRCAMLLYSLGVIELPAAEIAGVTQEAMSHLIVASAPEVLIYMMELAKVIEIDKKTGKIEFTEIGKNMEKKARYDREFYIG